MSTSGPGSEYGEQLCDITKLAKQSTHRQIYHNYSKHTTVKSRNWSDTIRHESKTTFTTWNDAQQIETNNKDGDKMRPNVSTTHD